MNADDDLTVDEAVVCIALAVRATNRLEARGVHELPQGQACPHGALLCGEATTLCAVAFMLLLQRFPQLRDPETFALALRDAQVRTVGGSMN